MVPFARAEKMKSDAPLDYAVFRLSPKRSRCDLFVSSSGSTEKIASGLLKPFIAHLKVAEEQVTSTAQSVKLEVGQRKDSEEWFTKGTLERFVRFVSTPEVLELFNTYDAEMSQLEAARRIYSQGAGDQLSGSSAADDATKKELLRAIDVRFVAVQQDLLAANARAAAAGFNLETISQLQMFADKFGAHRLNEACGKFLSLTERWPHLFNQWQSVVPEDRAVRSSYGSDMSIESDTPSPPPRQEQSSSQQSNPQPFTLPLRRTFSRDSSVETEGGFKQDAVVGEEDKKDGSSTSDQTESIQTTQPARRLSVQDRINLFENKQKESSGGKPVATKSVELRRMSSDVSTAGTAAEKAVLRRWSGASDMSIDLGADKKDTESSQHTPSTSPHPQECKSQNGDTLENSAVLKPEIKIIPSLRKGSDGRLKEASSSYMLEPYSESSKSKNLVPSERDDCLTDKVRGRVQSRDSLKHQMLGKAQSMDDLRVQAVGMTQLEDDLKESRSSVSRIDYQESSEESIKLSFSGKSEDDSFHGDQGRLKATQVGENINRTRYQIARTKDQGSSVTQISTIASNGERLSGISNRRGDSESGDTSVVQVSSKPTERSPGESGVLGCISSSKIRDAFAARNKVNDSNPLLFQQDARSVGGTEATGEKDSNDFEKPFDASMSGVEDSVPQRLKSNKQGSAGELSKKVKVRRDESFLSRNTKIPSSRKATADAPQGSITLSFPTPEQSERVKLSKGNQDVNDELRMKANELEKLFAEHKLRIPGDRSNSDRKTKPDQMHAEPSTTLSVPKSIRDLSPQRSDHSKSNEPTWNSKKTTKLSSNLPDSQNYVDALNKTFFELSVSEGSRGKLYDKYIQKRDAKLSEDWSSNRAEKEAALKCLQDSLERNRSEMKAKFAGSADNQDSVSSARRRAERLRSYNSSSITKMEQPPLNFEDSEFEHDGAMDDISFGAGSVRGEQGKMLASNIRNLSFSSPRSAAIPKSTSKASGHTTKRRMQAENPLAQSVPNFSDLRKENARPSGVSKATRSQVRNYARSKSTSEEQDASKEDKSRRFAALKKTTANDCGEVSSLDSEGVNVTPIKFDEEGQKSVVTKTFLKKGSRASYVSQAVIARSKASAGFEPVKIVDENNEIDSGHDEIGNDVKAEDQRFETLRTEGDSTLEGGEPVFVLDSKKFGNSGSEKGDGDLTISHANPALHSKLPSEITSSFQPGYPVQEWPGESPMSWNSHSQQHPFSYQHEMSDVDASVDSPVGSPASWNSNSLNQIETDAVRMRKKWGVAQKPVLAAHSINNSSRKDMTRGFKRLLNFGRKTRGSEGLVDWISATTSEGDDDTEDGRDPANRSSEDLRKSRMGFSQAQPPDDNFIESEFFNESVQSSQSSIPAPPSNFKQRDDLASGNSMKAPRSFFSLSSFMSKGSESKPR